MRSRPRRARWPRRWTAPTWSSGCPPRARCTDAMIHSMAKNPIIFAMANPDPEITPEEVAEVRDDAIMATGRSDYPNQVNNVLGFPYIFRGALDVRATTINDAMKIAAARGARRARARGRARRGGRRLPGQPPALRPALHHPGAVRSAPDLGDPGRRGQGGDGDRRGAAADRRHGRIRAASFRRGATRSPGRCSASTTACAASPSASSSPRARRSR